MKPPVYWANNGLAPTNAAGWQLRTLDGEHLGTVFLDGSWYCLAPGALGAGDHEAGSQPLAAQALLRAAGVEP